MLCLKKKRWTHINNLYINTLILILIPKTLFVVFIPPDYKNKVYQL